MVLADLNGDQDGGGPEQVQKCQYYAIFKKKQNCLGNYRLINLILVPRKVTEQDLYKRRNITACLVTQLRWAKIG